MHNTRHSHSTGSGLDSAAALLSSLCLVHCLALPLAAAALPALTLPFGDLPWLHAALLALALPVSGWALWRGWRLHGRWRPGVLAAAGFALMLSALACPGWREAALTVGGGLLVAAGHVLNLRAAARAR